MYNEAARFLKKDWVVKQRNLDKFTSNEMNKLN